MAKLIKVTKEDEKLLSDLGIEAEVKKKSELSPREERIIAGFEEIQKFVEENGIEPSTESDKDIFERLYATRLEQIRSQSECIDLLKDQDHQNLLNEKIPENNIYVTYLNFVNYLNIMNASYRYRGTPEQRVWSKHNILGVLIQN